MKKYGLTLLLMTMCCAFVFIAGSKVFASPAYQDGSLINGKIVMCGSSSDIDKEAVIDDDDAGSSNDEDKESVIDDDDKGASKEIDKDAVIDDDDKGAGKKVDKNAILNDDSGD
jgi:hypothetical protein